MGKSKEMFMDEQQAAPKVASRSMFNIRQDHATVLALIEENDGELSDDLLAQLQLTDEDFKDKAVSYGFLIKGLEAQAEMIGNEVRRLAERKKRLEKRAEVFREILEAAMREFGYDKIETPLLTLSFRKSKPVELSDTFADDILKYAEVQLKLREGMEEEATAAGVTEDTLMLFDVKPAPNKTRIGDEIKQGVVVPGASMVEKKNLQIR